MLQSTKKLNVQAQKEILQTKIALFGDQECGKTALLNRYLKNTFTNMYEPTLGVDTMSKYIQTKNGLNHITFWDFSGKHGFLQIRNQFFRELHTAIIVGDLSSKGSIEGIDYWFKQVKDSGSKPNFYLIGTKSDSKKTEGSKVASQQGCPYFQVSSKTGQNVQQAFDKIINQSK